MALIPNSFYYERRKACICCSRLISDTQATLTSNKFVNGLQIRISLTWLSSVKRKRSYTGAEIHALLWSLSCPSFSMVVSHLPEGPTAMFKISNFIPSSEVHNHGSSISSKPEVVLNNFSTRLGHRVGRFLGSFYKHVSALHFSNMSLFVNKFAHDIGPEFYGAGMCNLS